MSTSVSELKQSDPRPVSHRNVYSLFGSGTRVDVLWEFIKSPGEYLGPQELARRTGRSPGDVSRICGQLWQMNLITGRVLNSQDMKNSSLRNNFILNKEHPWIPGLRIFLENAVGTLFIIREEFKNLDESKINCAFVHGSFATDTYGANSDIDLIIIGKYDRFALTEVISKIRQRTGREVDYRVATVREWQKLYQDKNPFVLSVMSKPKEFIVHSQSVLDTICGSD
jgi:predicted nucleotidyltransferase